MHVFGRRERFYKTELFALYKKAKAGAKAFVFRIRL